MLAAIERSLLDIIKSPTDSTRDVEKWRAALVQLTDAFAAKGAQVNYFDLSAPDALLFSVSHDFSFGERERREYMTYGHTDPRLRAALRSPGRVLSCHLDVDRAALRDSEIYKHLLSRLGIEYTMWTHLPDTNDNLNVMGLVRGPEAAPFDGADCERFGALIPCFKRVAAIHRPQVVRALGDY